MAKSLVQITKRLWTTKAPLRTVYSAGVFSEDPDDTN